MWIVLAVLLVLFLLLQIKSYMAANKTHQQPYTVIKTEPEFEIRFYPPVIMASVSTAAKSYKELGNTGFRQLAAYIFGGNTTKQHIAMTAPVHMDMTDSLSTMRFVMPSMYNMDNLPKPIAKNVVIETSNSEYVAAVTFGGFASEKIIADQADILMAALKRHAISYHGNCRFLGYDPPYRLVGRKNDIIVTIEWPKK
jgi:SOUL heme-binding protein